MLESAYEHFIGKTRKEADEIVIKVIKSHLCNLTGRYYHALVFILKTVP